MAKHLGVLHRGEAVSVGWLTLRISRLFSERGRSSFDPASRQRSASGGPSGQIDTGIVPVSMGMSIAYQRYAEPWLARRLMGTPPPA